MRKSEGQRIQEKEIANFQFAVLVPSRVWGRYAPTRTRLRSKTEGPRPDKFLQRHHSER